MNIPQDQTQIKSCQNCILPASFPGIKFDEDGRCYYCKRHKGKEDQEKHKARFNHKFLSIINEIANTGPYDVLMAYSGGKDSTYTLRLLKENFDLKILAITFDHGFVSPMALKNIQEVTNILDIDHLTFRVGEKTLRELFVKSMAPNIYPIKSLERASSICNSCMNLVKSFLLKSAVEMRVPVVAFGWSPGQAPVQSSVFKTNASMIHQMQKAMIKPFKEMVGDKLSAFFLQKHHFERAKASKTDIFPCLVHPLAFMDYDEEHIIRNIKEIGWSNPKDTDANSTNCLLNGFANQVHLKQFGFHPYIFEIAGLIREGYMTKKEGLKRISASPDPKVIAYVKKRLGIKDNI